MWLWFTSFKNWVFRWWYYKEEDYILDVIMSLEKKQNIKNVF